MKGKGNKMKMNSFIKKHRIYFIGFIIWVLAISSIVLFRVVLKGGPNPKAKALMKLLDEEIAFLEKCDPSVQEKIKKHEFGLIKLSDGNFYAIGLGYENIEEALAENEQIIIEGMDNSIIVPPDVQLLIREYEISQIRPFLNNAQRHLLSDSRGTTVIGSQGNYSFIADKIAHKEYLEKYGIECPECQKKK
ncbi:hypothetical protein ACFLRX_09125 [Acidobacteriota bacterium]